MTISEQIIRAKADYDEVFEAGKRSVEATLKFTDVASNSYRITVPNNVEPFAKVNKIGGMTHKTRNLIPFPYQYQGELTLNGVTWNFTENGITASGTQETSASVPLYTFSSPITLNGTYTASLNKALPSNSSLFLSFDDNLGNVDLLKVGNTVSTTTINNRKCTAIRLWISAGATFNGDTFYPMLNEGSTALPYEPYFEGLRSASVSELKSDGANIANITYDKSSWIFNSGNGTVISTTENSIVGEGVKGSSPYAPYASNGWLTQRESTAKITQFKRGERISLSYDFEILELPTDYNGSTITIGCGFGFIGNYSASLWKQININFALGIQKVSVTFDVTDVEANLTPLIRIAFSSLHAKVSNIMINYGDVTSYKPYREGAIDTLPISEAIKSLDGYGLGVNSEYYNYIDFERKVFVQNVYRKVFDGTERWIAGASSTSDKNRIILSKTVAWDNKFPIIVSSNNIAPVISNVYNTVKADDTWVNVNGICINNLGELIIYDEAYNTSDISLWKAHLAELYASGNPLVIDYALAEPIETDISAYLTDEYIEVEGGGTITAVNEYGLDVPTNISYLIDTQGG